jgi:hypothetical protein
MGIFNVLKTGTIAAELLVLKQAYQTYGIEHPKYAEAYNKMERQIHLMSEGQKIEFKTYKRPY